MTIRVEVAYARPDQQLILEVSVKGGAPLREAVMVSGILEQFPEIDADQLNCGIFGTSRSLDHPLKDGDRVEIYRPLLADPRVARRTRSKSR
jgi:putative ubiquitin-RnfH superfamily antitoxin RatB of RatAB toxin-antitoxin module